MFWRLCIYGYGSIPIDTFLVGWTSIYQLFWCSPGVQGFDTLLYIYIHIQSHTYIDEFRLNKWGSDLNKSGAGLLGLWRKIMPEHFNVALKDGFRCSYVGVAVLTQTFFRFGFGHSPFSRWLVDPQPCSLLAHVSLLASPLKSLWLLILPLRGPHVLLLLIFSFGCVWK